MKPEAILQSDLLDILFEHRNKDYGAYALRRGYNRRLLTALTSIPVLLFLFFLWTHSLNNQGPGRHQSGVVAPDSSDYKLKRVEITKPPEKLPVTTAPRPEIAMIKNSVPKIVPDNVQTDPLPSVDDLMKDKALIGLQNIDGPAPEAVVAPPVTPPGMGETGGQLIEQKTEILHHAEKMPEFPGGMAALRRFLSRHLRVPENALEPGQRVRLPVRFVVNTDGNLTDVEFLVQADEAFRHEVLRVMNKMPRWIPGSQNGHKVMVWYTIPIIFEVSE